jgi:hypothetical protein
LNEREMVRERGRWHEKDGDGEREGDGTREREVAQERGRWHKRVIVRE